MPLITLDFETYWSADYTLSKMTTEAYVRSPQFHAQMVGIKIDDGPAQAFRPTQALNDPRLRRLIETSGVLFHHSHFDAFILAHHFGLKPAFIFDTLSMARLVLPELKSHSLAALARVFNLADKRSDILMQFKGKRNLTDDDFAILGPYCTHDVDLTYTIFKRMLPAVPKDELKIIDLTTRMFSEPRLRLDVPRTETFLNDLKTANVTRLAALGVTKEDLSSSARFSELLEQAGAEVPMKPSPANPDTEIPALAKTDEGMKALLEHESETVQLLAAARLGVKSTINETRAERLLDANYRGALPIYLKYWGAHTGRMSGADGMNWQNLTPALKKTVVAPPGYRICTVDSSQVECRGVNWLAGQNSVLDQFRQGVDIYSVNASLFYGYAVSKADPATKKERHFGKTLELACGFGMGDKTFRVRAKMAGIDLTEDEARRAIDLYRGLHPQVVAYWKQAGQVIEHLHSGVDFAWGPLRIHRHCIYLPNGAPLVYRGLEKGGREWKLVWGKGVKRIYGPLLVENVTQALFSGLLIREALTRIAARYPVVLTVHDDISYLAPEDEAEEALAFGLEQMRMIPWWADDRLPLDAEGGHSERYDK